METGRRTRLFIGLGVAAAILLGLFGRAKWRDLGLILLSGVITCAMAGSLYFFRMVYSRLMLPLLILGLMEILIILGVSVREKNEETDTDRTLTVMIVQAAVLVAVCYLFGTVWFCIGKGNAGNPMGFLQAVSICVLPYLVPDAAKLLLADQIAARVKKLI